MRPSAFELRRSELPSADLLCIFRTEGAEGEKKKGYSAAGSGASGSAPACAVGLHWTDLCASSVSLF